MTTCRLIKKSDLEILIESKDVKKINEMIEMKEAALKNASDNVKYWIEKGLPDHDFCLNEKSRVELLEKQLKRLREASQTGS